MSVPKNLRSPSEMEFLISARDLEIYSIKKCVGFPKRYTFYLSQPIANAATRVYECVKRANSIYPLNRHEAQLRRDYLLRANAELYSMTSQLEVAREVFNIEPCVLKQWTNMINTEMGLVKSLMKKDKERFRNLS